MHPLPCVAGTFLSSQSLLALAGLLAHLLLLGISQAIEVGVEDGISSSEPILRIHD